jgi:hypothetical protein
MLVHLPVFPFAHGKLDAVVLSEKCSENLLSPVFVFCGKYMLQIVFQVVLCELCHDAIFLGVKDDKVKILVGDFQELAGDFFEFFWGGRIKQALIPLPACVWWMG